MVPLPIAMLLTGEGETVFTHGKVALKKLRSITGVYRHGLDSQNYNAQTVQKLIINQYIEEVYCKLPEMLRSRTAIIDTTKLFTFGILYKKMNPHLAKMLFDSPILQEYNRKNRFNRIEDLSSVDPKRMEIGRAHV